MAQELKVPELKIEALIARSPADRHVEYDRSADTLYMWLDAPRPATSIDLIPQVWLRVDPTSGDILGLEIEAFREVFLIRHADLPRLSPRRTPSPIEKEGWIAAFVAFLSRSTLEGSGAPATSGRRASVAG